MTADMEEMLLDTAGFNPYSSGLAVMTKVQLIRLGQYQTRFNPYSSGLAVMTQ